MEFLSPEHAPALRRDGEKLRVFRHSVLGELLAATLFVAAPPCALWVFRAHVTPELGWGLLVKGPLALLGVGLWLLVAGACLHSLRASLRPTNWLMSVGRGGLHLNLRSYRNHHMEGEAQTVLHLDAAEIVTAGRVSRVSVSRSRNRTTYRMASFLELKLVEGIDTDAIAAVSRAEAERKAPTQGLLGGTTRLRFHHQPVFIGGSGALWVEWKGGMLDALDGSIRRAPKRSVREGDGESEAQDLQDARRRLQRLVGRGAAGSDSEAASEAISEGKADEAA